MNSLFVLTETVTEQENFLLQKEDKVFEICKTFISSEQCMNHFKLLLAQHFKTWYQESPLKSTLFKFQTEIQSYVSSEITRLEHEKQRKLSEVEDKFKELLKGQAIHF